jgi:NAD(P)-dependent dehydrogenase (short-subunit alcohol dehydrogenase family)
MNASSSPVAIVTGGASGIGLAIARKFVEQQIFTIVIGRNADKLKMAQEVLGNMAATIPFDISNLAEIPALVQKITEQYKRIDILVNNAGINQKKNFTAVTDEEFQNIMLTNVNAVFSLSREVVKVMEKQGSGSIINISSMAAKYGLPGVIAYSASKNAIEGMTKAMATELSGKGIRVNAIAPGFISTDMTAKAMSGDEERRQKVLARTPMGHFGDPADIAAAALFFATDSSKYITGTSLCVDGGNAVGF